MALRRLNLCCRLLNRGACLQQVGPRALYAAQEWAEPISGVTRLTLSTLSHDGIFSGNIMLSTLFAFFVHVVNVLIQEVFIPLLLQDLLQLVHFRAAASTFIAVPSARRTQKAPLRLEVRMSSQVFRSSRVLLGCFK